MLQIEDLAVEVDGKPILNNVNLEIPRGESHVLFGPNGSGKTSLMMAIMGFPDYRIAWGRIVFKGVDITRMEINERAAMGMGIMFQRPPTIHGVTCRTLVEICRKNPDTNIEAIACDLNAAAFLDRDVNAGLSGGEIKRSELLQLQAQEPDFVMLDEPESGVDLENIARVGEAINQLLHRGTRFPRGVIHKRPESPNARSALIVTHTGHILDYITADKGQVLYDGRMCCRHNAHEILKWIREYGYKECVQCRI